MRIIWLSIMLIAVTVAPSIGLQVKGVVVDSNGSPLADAEVVIASGCTPDEFVRTTSDKQGKFKATVIECMQEGRKSVGAAYAYVSGYAPNYAVVNENGETRIELEPGGRITGSVVDEKGNPVASARIFVWYANKPDGASFNFSCSTFRERFTSITDADGRWAFQDVPLTGTAYVKLSDPNYAENGVLVTLGADAGSQPVVARPAAIITGRVIDEDGKPAGEIGVICHRHRGGGGGAKTEEDGSYSIRGLSSGIYDVMARPASEEFVSTAVAAVKATEGETVEIPDVVLTTGAIVKGQIKDAETGMGVEGIYVGAFGGHNPDTTGVLQGMTTGPKGYYRLRVAPGDTTLVVSPTRQGYLAGDEIYQRRIPLTLTKGEIGIRDVSLRKGLAVQGTVVDEQGNTREGIDIKITVEWGNRGERMHATAKSEAGGAFSATPLREGRGHISAESGRFDSDFSGDWEVVEPKKIDVPTDGPVKVVVRRTATIPITGRVVSPSGAPVEGAAVNLRIIARPMDEETGFGGPVTYRTVVSDSDGVITYPDLRPRVEVTFQSAEKQGYAYVSGGEVTKTESALQISDIVMTSLSATIKGVVVDSAGNPVAGAKVTSPLRGLEEPVSTNEEGEFTLDLLPEGEVTIMAASSRDFASTTVTTGESDRVETIALTTPSEAGAVVPDIDLATEILKESWQVKGQAMWWRAHTPAVLAAYDPGRALDVAKDAEGNVPDEVRYQVFQRLMEWDRAKALAWGPTQMDKIGNPHISLRLLAMLGIAAADSDSATARTYYERAKDLVGKEGPQPELMSSGKEELDYALLAGLAARLGEPESEEWIARLKTAVVDNAKNEGQIDEALAYYTRYIAIGDADLAEKVALQLNEPDALQEFASIVAECSFYDKDGARRILATIGSMGASLKRAANYGQAALYVVLAFAPSEPMEMLELARGIKDTRYTPIALGLVAPYLDAEKKSQALRDAAAAVTQNWNDVPTDLAWLGYLAHDTDPELSRSLFNQAKKNLKEQKDVKLSDMAAVAYYGSTIDPAGSRLLLENVADQAMRDSGESARYSKDYIARAMAQFDTLRALEIARSIPESDWSSRSRALSGTAGACLRTTERQRRVDYLHSWRGDVWIYGGPTPR